MALIACPECHERVSDRALACPRCGYPLAQQPDRPDPDAPRPRLGPIKYLYAGSLLIGIAITAYVYVLHFDEFSETVLVQITPLWFFFLVVGYYGLVAERMLTVDRKSTGEEVADNLFQIAADTTGPFGKVFLSVIYLPFYFIKSRRSWVVAVVGAAMWAIALWFFFAVVFPTL